MSKLPPLTGWPPPPKQIPTPPARPTPPPKKRERWGAFASPAWQAAVDRLMERGDPELLAATAPPLLPVSERDELAVLAAVLRSPSLLPRAVGRLTEGDFAVEWHREAYCLMLELTAAGALEAMRERVNREERQDLFLRLGELHHEVDVDRFDAHVEVVRERSVRRRLIRGAAEIVEATTAGVADAREALRTAEDLAEDLASGRPPRAHPGA